MSSQNGFLINVPDHLWKVVLVLDRPGQGVADVTSNTMAFAIDIPNIDPATDNVFTPTSWQDHVISVQELENRLQGDRFNQYDFLSNIPTEIQEIIKSRSRTDILRWIEAVSPTASLMASPETAISSAIPISTIIAPDTSIRHDGFTENSALTSTNLKVTSPFQIGVAQVSPFESSFSQNSFAQVSMTEVSAFESGLTKDSSAQVSPLQINSLQNGFAKLYPSQVGITQVGITKISPVQNSIAEVSFLENNSSETLINQTDSWQLNPTKIPLPSSISSQQLLNIHTLTPESITTIKNTAQTLWNTGLAPQTSFNINLKLTDSLAKGQLAEAVVTKIDVYFVPSPQSEILGLLGRFAGKSGLFETFRNAVKEEEVCSCMIKLFNSCAVRIQVRGY